MFNQTENPVSRARTAWSTSLRAKKIFVSLSVGAPELLPAITLPARAASNVLIANPSPPPPDAFYRLYENPERKAARC